MEVINKSYPEFGYTVRYALNDDKTIYWEVSLEGEDTLMTGTFSQEDFYHSKFTIIPSNIEENTYESLFYLYFENIKLECITLVEDQDENIISELEEEM